MKKLKFNNENNTYEELIRVTLDLIDKKGGSKDVNLREIAKKLGFAHTNIYNYFDNFEDLLWAALKSVLDTLVQFTQSRLEALQIDEEGYLVQFVEAQVDFALSHPGWYHFIWLDQFKEAGAKEETIKIFEKMEQRFIGIIHGCCKGKLTPEEAGTAAGIIHGYLHGDICKLIAGRFLNTSAELYKERISRNIQRLIEFTLNPQSKTCKRGAL